MTIRPRMYIKELKEAIIRVKNFLTSIKVRFIEAEVTNIDTYKAALHLRNSLTNFLLKVESTKSQNNKIKVAVLGGGIREIELACELPVTLKKLTFELGLESTFDLEVSIVDRGDVT